MKRKYLETLLVVFILALVVFESVPHFPMTQPYGESFFQLYLLGSNHQIGGYFPNNSSDVQIGTSVHWFVGVRNLMGSIQYITLRFKLANESINPPNDTSLTPSPAPVVSEYEHVMLDNETWEFPFWWSIVNISQRADSLSIGLNLNGTIRAPNLTAFRGQNYRIIIELWVFNPQTDALEFGWSAEGKRIAWLQVWFNATLTHSI